MCIMKCPRTMMSPRSAYVTYDAISDSFVSLEITTINQLLNFGLSL